MSKLKIELKINTKKIEQFQDALKILIEAGMKSVYITEGQTKIYVYLGDDYRALVLNLDGTWELE